MAEQSKPPTVRGFFLVIWTDWGTRVSGIFSVPFTAAAVFASTIYGQAIWAAMAVLAIAFTTYRIWSKERARVVDLEVYLRPKLKHSFGASGCMVISNIANDPTKRKYFRIMLEADCALPVVDCQANLISLKRDGITLIEGEPITLVIAPGHRPNPETKTIRPMVPEYLDILSISETNLVSLDIAGFGVPNSIINTDIQTKGFYLFEIVISAPLMASKTLRFSFDWTSGDYNSVDLKSGRILP